MATSIEAVTDALSRPKSRRTPLYYDISSLYKPLTCPPNHSLLFLPLHVIAPSTDFRFHPGAITAQNPVAVVRGDTSQNSLVFHFPTPPATWQSRSHTHTLSLPLPARAGLVHLRRTSAAAAPPPYLAVQRARAAKQAPSPSTAKSHIRSPNFERSAINQMMIMTRHLGRKTENCSDGVRLRRAWQLQDSPAALCEMCY
ncbi:LANO_0G08614g1_1 [Lachancea nothofagi CBS 11611]|uniref:LANO_0G08614g1_1 n=1 Tax=Lachancea nothofagi CBS 11611 TaxID=1266666 RepID=A0A1G4KI51_9SACH|nr:LANO_0G08614g1_1 [Lachancea nothofagi CBS 11611]